jgi:hypothetical protein
MMTISLPPLFCLIPLLAIVAPAVMVLVSPSASGQGVPVQTGSAVYQGFRLPSTSGTLRYSLTGSERASLGYNGQDQTTYSTAVSGNLAFITQNQLYPTSLAYSGGYFVGTASQASSFFQSLSFSQSVARKYSTFTLSDSLSYLPESASVGLSGLPGLGDVGANPTPAANPGLLTEAKQIGNTTSAVYSRRLTGSTSLAAQGNYSIQRFLGGAGGLQSNSYSLGGSLQHRIDARSSFSVQYSYSDSSYVASTQTVAFQGGILSYNRMLTRHLSFNAGAGPQYVGASAATGNTPLLDYQLNGGLSYQTGTNTSASVAFARGVTGGQGVSYGGESDSVSAGVSRRLGRSLGVSGSFSYSKTTSLGGSISQLGELIPAVDSNGFSTSVQANRAIGRNLSVYVSYSLQHQKYQGESQGISPLNGNVQTVALGITYSPESIHLGRQ